MLLREFIRRLLTEEAISVKQAASEGLALARLYNSYDELVLVLYDPQLVREDLDIGTITANCIIGYIAVVLETFADDTPCWGANEVSKSAAQKGYGPLMYDIAMSIINEPLVPDRRLVKPQARAVWKHYKEKRSDVEALPLDNVNDPKTPEKCDDCVNHSGDEENPLNYAYEKKEKTNVSALTTNHTKALEQIIKTWEIDEYAFNSLMINASDDYFSNKYLRSPK